MRLVGLRHIDESKILDNKKLRDLDSQLQIKYSSDISNQDNQYLELLGLMFQNRINQVDSANRENSYNTLQISGC
jgi:hypothetical protein